MSWLSNLIPGTGSTPQGQRIMQGILTGNKVVATPASPAPKPNPRNTRTQPRRTTQVVVVEPSPFENLARIVAGAGGRISQTAARSAAKAIGARPAASSSADVGYVEPKGGKFLKKVYANYYNGGSIGPISGEEYAREQFKKSHKWARANTEQSNRDLEMAVRYLMMKPKKSPRYYNP